MRRSVLESSSSRFSNGHHTEGEGGAFEKFLSNSWPYSYYFSPLETYLLGVFTCVIAFAAYNFLFADSSIAVAPPRRRRRRGSRMRKSPRKRKNKTNLLSSTSKIPSIYPRSASKDDSSLPPGSSGMAEKPLSNDKNKTYRRLAGRISERAATRGMRKSNRMVNMHDTTNDNGFAQPAANGHHPIARNRARYNMKRSHEKIQSEAAVANKKSIASAYNDRDVWLSSASNASYELFRHMNSQQPQKDVQSGPANGDFEVAEAESIPFSSSVSDKQKNKSNHILSREHSSNKENFDMQLGRNGNPNNAALRITAIGDDSNKTTSSNKVREGTESKSTSPAEDGALSDNQSDHDRTNLDGNSKNSCGYGDNRSPAWKNPKKKSIVLKQQTYSLEGPCKSGLSDENVQTPGEDDETKNTNHLSNTQSNARASNIPQPTKFSNRFASATDSLLTKADHPMQRNSVFTHTPTQAAPNARVTVLISNGVCDPTQAAHQKAALHLLDDLHISYHLVDGMDPLQKEKRDAFFKISGIRGNYPQLFWTAKAGAYSYLGGYEWLHSSSENKELKASANVDQKPGAKSIDGSGSNLGGRDRPKDGLVGTASSDNTARARLTVLISNGVYDYQQAANQKVALNLLADLGISYDAVDGMDPLQREKRDALFTTSGIRGNYPQIFFSAKNDDNNTYLGGYDWLLSRRVEDLNAIFQETESPTFY